ncbi:MAG: DUF1207 domain-containing protein [Candidatus Kapabacteria bacterium]|nr:DUF1207 domain-containing protein [Candidatus Kapabacteria bacterium]
MKLTEFSAFAMLILQLHLHADDSRVLFKQLLANPIEARIGTMYQATDNRLRLDIGHTFDLMSVASSSDFNAVLGGDFFTYTRLRSEGNLKFPVETVDYFFGVNSSLQWKSPQVLYDARIRLSHISAHLTDGVADANGTLQPKPFVYSREFVDIIASVIFDNTYRVYAGGTFIFSNHRLAYPVSLIIPQAGGEIHYPITQSIKAQAGVDTKLVAVNGVARLITASQAGVSFKQMNGYSVFVGVYQYSGYSVHGLFFDTVDNYWGFGFQVQL